MATRIKPKSPAPKRGQSSEDYWREREARQRTENIRNEASIAERINRIFQGTQDSIEQEIDAFYQRYATKEGIDVFEARQRVSQIDMKKYERLAEQYVRAAHTGGREAAFSDEANEQMRLYNATMRINRLEMLKARCGIRAMEGYRQVDQLINESLEERAYSEYYRLAGILGNSVQFNENMVRSIVDASYQTATWSQRLWRNQAMLSEQIGAQLVQGILTGKSSTVLARNIQKLTGGSTYACQRLMRTELRRVQTAAAEQSMRDNGVQEYKFMVVNGVNPCDECLALDGQVFKVDDMAPGKNAPPVHPSCHCATAPYVDEEKWQRWLESGMKEPWEEFENDKAESHIPAFKIDDTERKVYTEKEINEMAKETEYLVSKHLNLPSKWSGKIVINGKDGDYYKDPSCYIATLPLTSPLIIMHEQIHARSSSYSTAVEFLDNRGMEEASVQLMTQEICKKEGIGLVGSQYDDGAEALREINRKYGLYEDDYTFAKEAMMQPLREREMWLSERVKETFGEDWDPSEDLTPYIEYQDLLKRVRESANP